MPTNQDNWFNPLGSPWIPANSPLSKVINYPRTAVRGAWEGLKDWGKEVVTPEQDPLPSLASGTGRRDEPQTAGQVALPVGGNQPDLPTDTGMEANHRMTKSAYEGTPSTPGGMWPTTPKEMTNVNATRDKMGYSDAMRGLQSAQKPDYEPGGGMGGPKIDISGTDMGGGTGGFGIPTTVQGQRGGYGNMEEVMRLANADEGTTAPGSQGYWGQEYKDRMGADEYQKLQAQKQQEAILEGLTAAHPAVSGAVNAAAQRSAIPAMANAQSQLSSAQITANARMMAAQITAAAGANSHLSTIAAGILRSIGQIAGSAQSQTDVGKQQLASLQDQLDTLYAQISGGVPQGAQ